jgi:hypothetical protein
MYQSVEACMNLLNKYGKIVKPKDDYEFHDSGSGVFCRNRDFKLLNKQGEWVNCTNDRFDDEAEIKSILLRKGCITESLPELCSCYSSDFEIHKTDCGYYAMKSGRIEKFLTRKGEWVRDQWHRFESRNDLIKAYVKDKEKPEQPIIDKTGRGSFCHCYRWNNGKKEFLSFDGEWYDSLCWSGEAERTRSRMHAGKEKYETPHGQWVNYRYHCDYGPHVYECKALLEKQGLVPRIAYKLNEDIVKPAVSSKNESTLEFALIIQHSQRLNR